MNVYICTDHDGHYPVGVASVVIAKDEKQARELLDAALIEAGLQVTDYTLTKLPKHPHANILCNGDY